MDSGDAIHAAFVSTHTDVDVTSKAATVLQNDFTCIPPFECRVTYGCNNL